MPTPSWPTGGVARPPDLAKAGMGGLSVAGCVGGPHVEDDMRIFRTAGAAAALLLAGGCNVTVNNASVDNQFDVAGNKAEAAAASAGNAAEAAAVSASKVADQAAAAIENKADQLGNLHVDVKLDGHKDRVTANTH
jgi:hypothetical protein